MSNSMDFNLRINNIFSYVLVVSTLVFLYSMSFEIRLMYQSSFETFHGIVILSFLYSFVSAVFWQYNGCLMALEGTKYKAWLIAPEGNKINREMVQMRLVGIFLIVLSAVAAVLWIYFKD